jgi:predicted house-cleaning NTP pyrophosphatase (Maf/HAM1 superfamily)
VTWIQGSFSSIIGLPLAETSALLSVAGIRVLK